MRLPNLNQIRTSASSITEFRGLNRTELCSESEFNKAFNVTTDRYPIATSRGLRRKLIASGKVLGLVGGDKLYVVYQNHIRVVTEDTAYNIDLPTALTDGTKSIVRMGAKLCIFPDRIIVDTESEKAESIENSFSTNNATFTLTNAYGDIITYHDDAYYESHDPANNDYLITEVDGETVLRRYTSSSGWVDITTSYIQITSTGIGKGFKKGVGVKFSVNIDGWAEGKNIFPNDNNGRGEATYVLKSVSDDAVTIAGILKNTKTVNSLTMKRECPNLAYVTEYQNRLWGCNEKGTEIYASALGDATSWNTFEGISTDSYAATIGSEGRFTGAITYLGYPMFFKKDSLIKVAVSANGGHVLKEVFCRGVADGCSDSLTIVNELLYYKATDSVMMYDGSLPTRISDALGDISDFKDVVGGCYKGKLYLSGSNGNYVYDTKVGAWTETDDTFTSFATFGEAFVYAKDTLVTLSDYVPNIVSQSENNKDIKWELKTRDVDYIVSSKGYSKSPNAKYVQKIVVKVALAVGSSVKISVRYDDKPFETLIHYQHKGTGIIPISLKMRRCNSFAIKIEGLGEGSVYSITKVLAEGSDKY